ncbi:CHAT domain-containing protein [Dactylosporangium sp. CA-139066]|uniref:CHAT domain-containing protein n=1 Tax=Dactylosporangium sp. CA-139066 TaxID=3239930 RepID=UPI003D918D67
MSTPPADLGMSHLDRYSQTGNRADLDAAIEYLIAAHAADPGHPDAADWQVTLGRLYAHRADDLPPGHARRDWVVDLMDDAWSRSWMFRYNRPEPDEEARADAERLVTTLEAFHLNGLYPPAQAYARLLTGAAHFEAYTYDHAARAHLDAGLAAAGPALTELLAIRDASPAIVDELAPDSRLALLAGMVSFGFEQRGGPDDLDRAVWAAQTAESLYRAAEPDAPLPDILLEYLAEAHRTRCLAGADPGDLDAAIAARTQLLDRGWDPWCAVLLGELLAVRADERRSAPDARRAIELLGRLARESTDPDPWPELQALARVEALAAELEGDQATLRAAAGHLDAALACDIPDHDELLQIMVQRIAVQAAFGHDTARAEVAAQYRELVERAHGVLRGAVRADAQQRAAFCGVLGYVEMTIAAHGLEPADSERIRGLFAVAATARDLGPEWESYVAVGLGALEYLEYGADPRASSDAGLNRLAQAAAVSTTELVGAMLRIVVDVRSGWTGFRRAGASPSAPSIDASLDAYHEFIELNARGDRDGLRQLADRYAPILAGERAPDASYVYVGRLLEMADRFADPAAAPLVELRPLQLPADVAGDAELAHDLALCSVLFEQGRARRDADIVRRAAEYAEKALTFIRPGHPQLTLAARLAAGAARLELAHLGEGAGQARLAEGHYAEAMRVAGDHEHPMWWSLALRRAEAVRMGGGPAAASRELGLSALRGFAWQVAAKAGTEYAIVSARDAGAAARVVAGWCLADRDRGEDVDEQLIAALDAGRALVLQAASSARQIPGRLERAGQAALARIWEATDGEGEHPATDELPLRALRTLTGDGSAVAGFEAVTTAEIRAALATLGADALVYLRAGGEDEAGAAVIVPARGPATVLPMPGLHPPVPAHSRWPMTAREVVARTDVGDGLDEVCAWAWRAAIGGLLDEVGAWGLGRPARLVLVPLGVLGAVPWHAARGPRHAVEAAVFSYTPSARHLCASAAAGPAAGVGAALVVGDPGGDLPFAGAEAAAIHREFYPGGTYLGGGAGSAQAVLGWIDAAPAGPLMLHFACHGAIDPERPADAHLVLAGGAPLPADVLLERARRKALDLGEVFLAACTTGVTGEDHDEVLSLATSFLAAGARTVFGSMWPVPDGDTSVLMYMVHHFLRVEGLPAADALHRAQRWMLDPARVVPERMPAELRRHCAAGTVFGPASWAGFTHVGR